ncbi:hypothetical protein FA95DRAFT_1385844 [Auriscalpium vulgare]|uniref:Uncharacterized protein n=1 Tax=Auriscalpium vulgare TaxID=40419 RepID=A0ACB8S8S2_9AGAM|nr:hypothetical protein FA95DRAFT_1385844 [Auriscalpium vulgare]
MEHFHQDHPYISDLDNLDISPQHNSFEDFHSPRFPATPSYNGSYQNSPYSVVSELDFDSKHDALGLFDADPLVVPATEDYDPNSYDPPASAGLLMFDGAFMSGVSNDDHHVSLSVTPAEDRNPYDQPSPSSSAGGQENDRSSPASSISDHPHPSPHINFNQLHVDSPYLPSIAIPSEHASPQMKPQSPPTLQIPDEPQPRQSITAPGVHIVPATPVSGGVYRNQGLIAQGASPCFSLPD